MFTITDLSSNWVDPASTTSNAPWLNIFVTPDSNYYNAYLFFFLP